MVDGIRRAPVRPQDAVGRAGVGIAAQWTLLLSGSHNFDDLRAVEWWAALDFGFVHYTVALLGCRDSDGRVFVVDEHAERMRLPQRHAAGIKGMLARHRVAAERGLRVAEAPRTRELEARDLRRFVAGADVFSQPGHRHVCIPASVETR